jgi:hypothetical protein
VNYFYSADEEMPHLRGTLCGWSDRELFFRHTPGIVDYYHHRHSSSEKPFLPVHLI